MNGEILRIFDTHAHYDDEAFDEDRDELLNAIHTRGVEKIINCGCDLKSSLAAIDLAEKFGFVFAAAGIHPESVTELADDEFERVRELYSHPKVVAVGEIGLDYYWDMPRDLQFAAFERQLILSKELDLPVIIHDREAHEDTLKLLKKHKVKGVMHCYSGSVETMKEIIDLGLYVGLGGVVTFKNAKKPIAVAAAVPEDRLLLETDCPYMAPVPFRGKRCDSSMIAETAKVIAAVRGVEPQALVDKCAKNAKALFGI